jgi:hypothetical protein
VGSTQGKMTRGKLVARTAELEKTNLDMFEDQASPQEKRSAISTHKEVHMQGNVPESSEQPATDKHGSRRRLLRKGLVAASVALGAGTLLETGKASAQANIPADNVGNFSSSNASIPAVTATGTNGAVGVQATSDSGTGLNASSGSFNGIHATSGGTGASGLFAEGVSGGYGVYSRCRGGTAVVGEGGSGTGVYGYSDVGSSGFGVIAYSPNGTALQVNGPMQLKGSSVGQATLAAGKTSVTVTSPAATASSNILLTPLGNPLGNLWVTRATGSFTIHASKAPTSNLSIAYLIIN